MISADSKVYVAGHGGMVGSAICRKLQAAGFDNVVTRTSTELDLRVQADVNAFFEQEQPEYVYLAAARVGGIQANSTYWAEFLYDNLMIAANVIHAAYLNKVKKGLFLGSSCIYPRLADQPIPEEALMTGALEPTNEPYAIAKIAGVKLCQAYRKQYGCNFISAMPTNLYGSGDTYHLEHSHVVPAMIRKFHEALAAGRADVELWGSGSPKREFLFVDDLADACLFLMEQYDSPEPINVGSGHEMTISELAGAVRRTVGFEGMVRWDPGKPDGTPRKLLDTSKLATLGWQPKIDMEAGLKRAYADFLNRKETMQ